MNKIILLTHLCLLLFAQCHAPAPDLPTPLEQSDFSVYTSNKQLIGFLNRCDSASNFVSVEYQQASDYQIPVVFVSNPKKTGQKIKVMLLAQQHGNEPSGMEGLLMLISGFAEGSHHLLLDSADLIILPQCNPWGGDRHQRRNAAGIDLNRDHLLHLAEETRIIQHIFENHRPHMTVDFHEYYPFSKSWEEFGYRRNWDIQFGGPTNANIDSALRALFYELALPFARSELERQEYRFAEYTLGNFALGERLRHSTVDVNDGRQSFGIAGSFAMIVEGMNGRDSLDNMERRAKSQHATALSLLQVAHDNKSAIMQAVTNARTDLLRTDKPVSIRQDHFKGDKELSYSLLSLKTNKDTVFRVEEYHSVVRSLLDVLPPKGYLVPKKDEMLVNWLMRSNFKFAKNLPEGSQLYAYRIIALKKSIDEELENLYPEIEKTSAPIPDPESYYFVPTGQIYQHKIITALEPQAMYGLASYPEFGYLLQNEFFPIIRVEQSRRLSLDF